MLPFRTDITAINFGLSQTQTAGKLTQTSYTNFISRSENVTTGECVHLSLAIQMCRGKVCLGVIQVLRNTVGGGRVSDLPKKGVTKMYGSTVLVVQQY